MVFDRVVSADPAFRKAWLLHGLERPTINGSQTIFKDTRAGYTGKLTVDTLLPKPDDLDITAVGGAGRENWVDGAITRPCCAPTASTKAAAGGSRYRQENPARQISSCTSCK